MDGPEPTNDDAPLNTDAYYGAFLYWLDRMFRSRHQLVERLALVFHDWWATNNDSVGSNRFMLDQTNIFRAHGLGSFRDMAGAVTTDPAMLLFLNGLSNRRGATSLALEQVYSAGNQIRPVLEAILCAPEFYEGPRMVKPPIVLCAGMLRARERAIDDERWWSLCDGAGQRVYYPPDVSGWNDQRWLDTNTVRGRWDVVSNVLIGQTIPSANWSSYPQETPEQAVNGARAFWGSPDLTPETHAQLVAFATTSVPADPSAGLRAQRQNALRQLVAAGPDYQTC